VIHVRGRVVIVSEVALKIYQPLTIINKVIQTLHGKDGLIHIQVCSIAIKTVLTGKIGQKDHVLLEAPLDPELPIEQLKGRTCLMGYEEEQYP
jgi:hypothetical protein